MTKKAKEGRRERGREKENQLNISEEKLPQLKNTNGIFFKTSPY